MSGQAWWNLFWGLFNISISFWRTRESPYLSVMTACVGGACLTSVVYMLATSVEGCK